MEGTQFFLSFVFRVVSVCTFDIANDKGEQDQGLGRGWRSLRESFSTSARNLLANINSEGECSENDTGNQSNPRKRSPSSLEISLQNQLRHLLSERNLASKTLDAQLQEAISVENGLIKTQATQKDEIDALRLKISDLKLSRNQAKSKAQDEIIELQTQIGNLIRSIDEKVSHLQSCEIEERAAPPLSSAVSIESDHKMRMRVCRKLLEKGADPNAIINTTPPRLGGPTESTVLSGAACRELGGYSEADRLELLKLLLDFGADPGQVMTLKCTGRSERCTAIHNVVSRRQTEVLRLLLSTDKGKAAVDIARREWIPAEAGENNGDGETALTMVVGRDMTQCQANRDIAVQLLAAGANPDIKDAAGISPSMWLDDPDPQHAELKRLVKKSKDKGKSFWDPNSPQIKAFIEIWC